MAKIKPLAIIETMTGKVCTHSDMSFVCSKKTGRVHTMKMCNPYQGPYAATQIAARDKFKQAVTNAKAVIAATASDQDDTNYQKKVAYRAEFERQTKNPAFYAFVVGKEYALIGA